MTQFSILDKILLLFRRNGESPIKGIDTLHYLVFCGCAFESRNGESPIKGIIKKVTQTMIKSPFKAVKW